MRKYLLAILLLLISACSMPEINNLLNSANKFVENENVELAELNKEMPNAIILPTKCSDFKNKFTGTPQLKPADDYVKQFKGRVSGDEDEILAKIGYYAKKDINIIYDNKNIFSYSKENFTKIISGTQACSKSDSDIENYGNYMALYMPIKLGMIKEPNIEKNLNSILKSVPNAKDIRVITHGRFQLSRSYYSIARFFIDTNPDNAKFSFSKKEMSISNMYGTSHLYFKETTKNTLVLTMLQHPDGTTVTDGDGIDLFLSVIPE